MSKVISETVEAADPQGAALSPSPKVLLFEKLLQETQPRELLDVLPAAIYTTDAKGRITYFNDAAAALWGCRPRLNTDQWCGSWQMYRPDGTPLPHDQRPMAIALKEGRPIRGVEAIAERPDGTRVPFMTFPTPLRDGSGALIGAVNMLIDLTEHKSAERSARRLVSIVESSDDAIVSKDLNGVIATWNKGAERLFGYFAEEIVGKSIMTIIPADRQDEEAGILERIRRGERVEHFETVRRHKNGRLVNISLTLSPVRDGSGTIIGASKIARDITDQKRREEQIALLAREADHRAKNLLALAQATVHLSQGETPDALKAAIEGRLRALAHAHALLARSRWAGADLRTMVMEELSPYCQNNPERAQVDGSSMMLEQQAAQAMAVAVHELTTNAVKYGALSTPKGRVRVQWSCDPTQRLTFRWTESGGPPVALPKHRGFGARVIERIIESQLNGDLKFEWREEGIVCEIAIDT